MKLCPCHSGKTYQDCCQHYHDGFPPDNAMVLMRSRYSAYALGLTEYILKTTHPENPLFTGDRESWRRSVVQFSENTRFEGLTIRDFKDGDEYAEVMFTAYLFSGGKDTSFTEKSLFKKEGVWWLYLGK